MASRIRAVACGGVVTGQYGSINNHPRPSSQSTDGLESLFLQSLDTLKSEDEQDQEFSCAICCSAGE